MTMLANEDTFQAIEQFCEVYPSTNVLFVDSQGKVNYASGEWLLNAEQCLSAVQRLNKMNGGRAEKELIISGPDGQHVKVICLSADLAHDDTLLGRLLLLCDCAADRRQLGYAFGLLAERIIHVHRQKIMKTELETQRCYQDAIAESVSDGLLLVNKMGRVNFINTIGARILGVNREWALGRHIAELVDFKPVVLDVIETGKGYTDKEFVLKGTKKTFHFMKTAVPIKDEHGEVVCVVDTFREIKRVQRMVTSMSGLSARFTFDDIVGESLPMKECIRMARVAAQSSSNVLIQGESGTGKELLAQAIHNASSLNDGPFVAVNCAAIPRELIESELFGYEEGAFTGAVKGGRPGKFELANEGTIFLDEIGDMPLDMQVKLLRVIQERKVMRIGGTHMFNFNGRIIAASNRDLQKDVNDGAFRRDLFYRLNVLMLHIPPLRERKGDLAVTVRHVLKKLSAKLERDIPEVDEEAFRALAAYDWPGNVRELENVLERAINIAAGKVITLHDLPKHLSAVSPQLSKDGERIRTLDEVEQEAIKNALLCVDRNISRASQLLGVTRNTLYNKIKKYALEDCSNIIQ